MSVKDKEDQAERKNSAEQPKTKGESGQSNNRLSGTMVSPGPKKEVPEHLFWA